MSELTPYEKKAKAEIEKWRNEEPGMVAKALNLAGAPIEMVQNAIPANPATRTLREAVLGALGMLRDASQWTYPDSGIVAEARKVGLEVEDYRELRDCDLDKLDKVAQQFFTTNKLMAALEGSVAGLGGLIFIAADVPALFTVSFRAVQQIGSSYGFDMEDPDMLPVVLSIFNASSAASSAAKAQVLTDMRVAAAAFGKNWTYKKVAQETNAGVVAKLLKEQVKHLPKEIADNVTKRKLSQSIPIIGAAVGATANYWFLSNATRGAYMVFREMHIEQKRGGDPDVSEMTAA